MKMIILVRTREIDYICWYISLLAHPTTDRGNYSQSYEVSGNLINDCLKSCATDICNVSFDDIGWIQATLPIRLGGIGLPLI